MQTKLLKILLSFFCIYFIWGSTYLATKWAFVSFPPFLMTSTRFLMAALIMAVLRIKHLRYLTFVGIRNAMMIGFLILGIGTGCCMWALQFMDTSLASILVSTEPAVLVFVSWWILGLRPTFMKFVGILLGLIGVYLLSEVDYLWLDRWVILGAISIAVAVVSWSFGSVYIKLWTMPKDLLSGVAIQLFSGGMFLLICAMIAGENTNDIQENFEWIAFNSWVYLVIFGSVIAYTAFTYLLMETDPNLVATCTYVNPVVAIFLGVFLNDEVLTQTVLMASAIMIIGVVLIVTERKKTS